MDNNGGLGVASRLSEVLSTRARSQNWLAAALGVSQSTLNRQMREDSLPTETVVRAAELLGLDLLWLLRGGAEVRDERFAREVGASDTSSLEARLDAIEGLDLSEALKILKVEALGAVIRAEAIREAERAATIRARSLELAEGAATERAKAIEREAEAASVRAGVMPIGGVAGEPISDAEIAANLPPPAATGPQRAASQASGMRGGPRTRE